MATNITPFSIDILDARCPSRLTLEVIADKWTMLIIVALSKGTKRNGDLLRGIGGISQKMLTQTLRRLEHSGLVHRHVYQQVPPKVEYELTDLGRTLLEPIWALREWAQTHYQAVVDALHQAEVEAVDDAASPTTPWQPVPLPESKPE